MIRPKYLLAYGIIWWWYIDWKSIHKITGSWSWNFSDRIFLFRSISDLAIHYSLHWYKVDLSCLSVNCFVKGGIKYSLRTISLFVFGIIFVLLISANKESQYQSSGEVVQVMVKRNYFINSFILLGLWLLGSWKNYNTSSDDLIFSVIFFNVDAVPHIARSTGNYQYWYHFIWKMDSFFSFSTRRKKRICLRCGSVCSLWSHGTSNW